MQAVTTDPALLLADELLYPESDGQPMAETEFHGEEMVELRRMLRRHFRPRAEDVYVGSNLFVYYERGNPRAVFSPDVFVVFGAPQRLYDTYKLWQDGPAPHFVIEVSSKKTALVDKGNKKATCEMLGVVEYFLYDPRAEYLQPPLQGYRLETGQYHPIDASDDGALEAETLGLTFSLGPDGRVVVHETASGRRLLRTDEETHSLETERDREREARRDAERKLQEALRELKRLQGL